ncbi:MAG: hypothetical protein WKG06_44540 [Segetibacter sp.]
MLSKDFIRLVVVAVIIAVPLAWWAANKWLESFAYRINISWWMFAIAALIVMAIAIVTISIQTIKAAAANPVKSLRTESTEPRFIGLEEITRKVVRTWIYGMNGICGIRDMNLLI